jgi:hypothetical protein
LQQITCCSRPGSREIGSRVGTVGNRREYPQGGCMNPIQSSSDHFEQHLKIVGGSEADVSGSNYLVTPEDTVESAASGLRIKQQQQGTAQSKESTLHAAAQVLISRRTSRTLAIIPGRPSPGSTNWTSITRRAAKRGNPSLKPTCKRPRSGPRDGSKRTAPTLAPSTSRPEEALIQVRARWSATTTAPWAGTGSHIRAPAFVRSVLPLSRE